MTITIVSIIIIIIMLFAVDIAFLQKETRSYSYHMCSYSDLMLSIVMATTSCVHSVNVFDMHQPLLL